MNKRILLYVLLLVGLSLAFERPKLDLSGMIMVHAYADWNTDESNVVHRYESMLDLDFDVRFNDRWSAWLEIEAMGMAMDGMEEMEGMDMGDDATMDPVHPTVVFNGAYVQYAPSEHLAFRIGDLNYFEGLFKNYYDFGDPRDDAAGIRQKSIRGVEFLWNGLQLNVGFGSGSNDQSCYYHYMFGEYMGMDCKEGLTYEIHAAYDLEIAGQVFRPYADYKSYQRKDFNELYAGLDISLSSEHFALHGLYGFHSVFLASDDAVSNHVFLAEPSFEFSRFCIIGSLFYAVIDDPERTFLEMTTRPEYFFVAVEPSVALLGGHQKRLALLFAAHPEGDFAGEGGLTGTLQANHHNADRSRSGKVDFLGFATHHGHEFVVDDFHNLLTGSHRGKHFGAHGLFLDGLNEVAGHVEVHVGFEECTAHFAQRFGDVFFGELALPAQVLESRF